MLKFKTLAMPVVILLVVSQACGLQATVPTIDPNLINTAIVQTMSSALTQTAQKPIIPITGNETPTSTFIPTFTASPTLSPTPIFTATPLIPLISVSVPTNCRVGPGKVYDLLGALLVGEVAEVVGRDSTGNYWYIRNPDRPNDFCWLWGEYATLSGNYMVLPVFTPPPTPTPAPAFEAYYDDLDSCNGWWVDLRLKNTGSLDFKSLLITLKDLVKGTSTSLQTNGFTDYDGCHDSVTRDTLYSGNTYIVSTSTFDYNLKDNKLRASVTLCSEKGLNGVCVTQVIDFTP